MIVDDIREALKSDPFEPFRVVTSSGESYAVRDPQAVAIMKSRLFVTLPRDRWTFASYLHITAIEKPPNGRTRGPRKR
jgi:hypothetical protein